MHCSQDPGVPSAALLPVGTSLWSAGSEVASQMEAHHPEMVTATKATLCGSHTRVLSPLSPATPKLSLFYPWGFAM